MACNFDIRVLSSVRKRQGFSLAELVISLFIISVLSVTVGMAMYRSQHKASRSRDSLTQLRNQNYVFQRMETDLRFASSLMFVSINELDAIVPGLGVEGADVMVTYSWDSEALTVRRQSNAGSDEIIATNVYCFEIYPDMFMEGEEVRLNGIEVTIRFDIDASKNLHRYITTMNID